MVAAIIPVWKQNFGTEISRLERALFKYKVVSIDTEFPGFILNTPRDGSETERYKDLKFNVDALKLIQLGITLSDERGTIFGTWEFNFCFDLGEDLYVLESVEFLKKNGLDFDKHARDGIHMSGFAKIFTAVLAKHRDLFWVTFHGLYDLAYALGLITMAPLPNSVLGFTTLLGSVFGRVVDVKYMARFCKGLCGGELGLSKLASILRIERKGGAHQAGSDSLLTALVFAKINMVFPIHQLLYLGSLYGIQPRISPTITPPPLSSYCIPQINNVPPFLYGMPCNQDFMYYIPT
ncbi:unnamed protein product [Dovyalis caffra]|uniref:poly(A)-specific ribonuclease n=1 Tax=Dovyalis caffra TaxID=77055 RepID=A0AAV1SJG1_9ROSI|nr:unnamed protein product [Dovyalis caffra]